MAQNMTTGNSVRPLRNVAALSTLISRLENRAFGLPGMATFHGPTGYGKTFAATHAAIKFDAIHVSVQRLWTISTLLEMILKQLRVIPARTRPKMLMQVCEHLLRAGRPLIIDEADYAIDRNMLVDIRDMYDGSLVPVILIGMERLPQKIKKWDLVDGRVGAWAPAEPADLRDAKMIADCYAPGLHLDDALIDHIRALHRGQVRRMSTDFAYVLERSRLLGVNKMTLKDWGDVPFLRGEAPAPREGL